MAKHWRKEYRRKDGTFVKAGWVRGRNPAEGCKIWLIGMILLVVAAVRLRPRRRLAK